MADFLSEYFFLLVIAAVLIVAACPNYIRVIACFFAVSVLHVYLFGWVWGIAGILFFLLGAWGYARSGAKPGPLQRFLERLGLDAEEDHQK